MRGRKGCWSEGPTFLLKEDVKHLSWMIGVNWAFTLAVLGKLIFFMKP
jgi:hypothetical protein